MNQRWIGLFIMLVASTAQAQVVTSPTGGLYPLPAQAAPTSAPLVAAISAPSTENILRAGTEVPLVTREELTTKKKQLRVGQRVQLEVSANVEMNGVVVVPVGTPAIAEITEVRNKGMWGKSGYINCRIISMRLGDRTVRLSGSFDDKGVTGTAGVVAAVVLIPVVGFFTTGTSANIPAGSGTKGFLDEDIAFRTVAAPAPVLVIPITAPPPAAPALTAQPPAG